MTASSTSSAPASPVEAPASRSSGPTVRVIARLDIKGPDVVKGFQFEGVRRVGMPGELARRYYADGADEIVFIDTVASLYGRNTILSVVEEVARDVFVPLAVGGGLRSVEDIKAVLRVGADKVAINTAAVHKPDLINEAANAFGSQCIILSVQAMRQPDGTWEAYTDNARERSGRNVLDWVVEAESRGAGEILLTAVEREGGRNGFDVELVTAVRRRVKVPVIAHGGAGSARHVVELMHRAAPDAVACASIFHYGLCPLPELKRALAEAGVPVRL